jgi:hypothetical protein
MAPLMPTTDPNLATFFSAIGTGRLPTNLNSQMPPATAASVPSPIPPTLGVLMPTTNEKRAAYAFKVQIFKSNKIKLFSHCLKILQVVPGEPRTPVSFPSDASFGADIPK